MRLKKIGSIFGHVPGASPTLILKKLVLCLKFSSIFRESNDGSRIPCGGGGGAMALRGGPELIFCQNFQNKRA